MRDIKKRLKLFVCLIAAFTATGSYAASKTLIYEYDALGRVVVVQDNVNEDRNYTYDKAGNRKKLRIGGENLPPVAVDDRLGMTRLYSAVDLNLTANDSDPEGDELTISAVGSSSTLSVEIINNSTVRVMAIGTLLPEQSISYTVTDSAGNTDTGLIVVFTVSIGLF